MMQSIKKGVGGIIEAQFPGARPTSVAVSVYTNKAAAKVSAAAATLDTVNTTLGVAAARGDLTVTLTSATGVVAGRRYLIGTTNGAEAPEAVTVRKVASSVATLWAPLLLEHSMGAAFAGTRASYTVSAGAANEIWWDGYADWTPTGGDGDVVTEVVNCVLRPIPRHLIDETHVRSVWAEAHAILPATLDMPLALLEARDEFVRRLGSKNRADVCMGLEQLRRPCAKVFWLLRRFELGDNYERAMDKLEEEVKQDLADIQYQSPFDNDQDGKTNAPADGGYSSSGERRL